MYTQFIDFIQQNLSNSTIDFIMIFFTEIGHGGLIWLLIAIVLIVQKKYRKYGAMIILSLILTFLIGDIFLKNIIGRQRPFIVYNIDIIIPNPNSFSFPSGHTASSFAAAFILCKINKKIGAVAFTIASLIAFSRIYLIVHYPSDNLGGIILGLLCGLITYHFFNKRLFEYNSKHI